MKKLTSLLALIFIFLLVGTAQSRDLDPLGGVSVGGGLTPGMSLTSGDRGRIGFTRANASLSLKSLGFEYETRTYSWGEVEKIPFGNGRDKPWKTLHSVMLHDSRHGMFNSCWGYWGGFNLSSDFEPKAREAISGSAHGGLLYSFSEQWQVSLGVSGGLDQVNFEWFPLAAVNFNDRAGSGFSFSLGIPESEIRYDLNPSLNLRMKFSYDRRTYRLARDSTVQRSGFARIQEGLAGLALDYKPVENLVISLGPELRMLRKITIYNRRGHRVKGYGINPVPGAMVQVSYSF
ncbi:MAG: hypothetical protein V1816_15585 [Pseudomonadota bacterium]